MKPGLVIGKYTLVEKLGEGGMGEIWLADDAFGHRVAAKFLVAGHRHSERHLKRFIQEAQTLSALKHRNICRIYGVEEYDGYPVLIIEYEQGVSLARLLRFLSDSKTTFSAKESSTNRTELTSLVEFLENSSHGKPPPTQILQQEFLLEHKTPIRMLPLQQALAVISQLCDAVHYAHEHGILHRDIKPSNVVIRRDGEPVLLDFGVAKFTTGDDPAVMTASGEIFGTVDYMAPEQALSAHHIDERADVYSIGVILYELTTGHKYFNCTGNLVADVKRLEQYEPVPPRFHVRTMDRDLEAIILKATGAEPDSRYRSARQLAADIQRYQECLPVTAAPRTIMYRLRKWAKRHRMPILFSSAIVLLTAILGGFLAWDYYRQWGNWIKVFGCNFATGEYDTTQFVFINKDGHRTAAWPSGKDGLATRPGEWCWLAATRVQENVRIRLNVRFAGNVDGFEAVINGEDARPRYYWELPRGYSCQAGGYQGTLDFVSINKKQGVAGLMAPARSRCRPQSDVEIIFEREEDRVTLRINGRRQCVEKDNIPFTGPEFARIGFHGYADSVSVLSLDVYHLSLPARTRPLVAGDAFISKGYYRDAVERYCAIADDFIGSKLGEDALFSAFMAAMELDTSERARVVDSVLVLLEQRFPSSPVWQRVRERRMMDQWLAGEISQVIAVLPSHYTAWPRSRIAQDLVLAAPPPPHILPQILPWQLKTRGAAYFNVAGLDLRSLAGFEKSDVVVLDCQDNRIDNLEPLRHLKLMWLKIHNNMVVDLEPLRGHPLRILDVSRNKIRSLKPVAHAPLSVLDANFTAIEGLPRFSSRQLNTIRIDGNRLTDIEPLRGVPCRILTVMMNSIASLEPLRGMSLSFLEAGANRIQDLSVLEGMPLKHLGIEDNPVKSGWEAVRGLRQLKSLYANRTGLRDLSILKELNLEDLACNNNDISDLSPLDGMPLKILYCADNNIHTLAPVASMQLTTLHVGFNQVSSLAPLQGMGLIFFNCIDNPITSLGHFVEHPPEWFFFFTPTLPARELDRAIRAWDKNPDHAHHARNARLIKMILQGNIAGLKALGSRYDGRTCLGLPIHYPFERADSLCRALGGHFPIITDNGKLNFVSTRITQTREVYSFAWLGLENHNGRYLWQTGEPATFIEPLLHSWGGGHWTLGTNSTNNQIAQLQPGVYAWTVIEWDD